MQFWILTSLLALSVGAANAATIAPRTSNHLTGDYVEARTASVFAGACHFNGELTTTGNEAEMVWHVREGAWNGTFLNGLTAMAAVVSDANLRNESTARRSVLYIDAKATPSQAEALAAALEKGYAKSLGAVVAVRRVPITFTRKSDSFRVEANDVGRLQVEALPNRECCKQPNLVWYKPLVALTGRRVGYTLVSGIQEKTLGTHWSKQGQNTAFYGDFVL